MWYISFTSLLYHLHSNSWHMNINTVQHFSLTFWAEAEQHRVDRRSGTSWWWRGGILPCSCVLILHCLQGYIGCVSSQPLQFWLSRGAGAEHIPKLVSASVLTLLTHSGGRVMAAVKAGTLRHSCSRWIHSFILTSQFPQVFPALLALLNAFIQSRKDKRQ